MTTLKPATFGDIAFLWFLRNQPDAYQYFEHPQPVTWEEHINWITPIILQLVPRKLYIVRYEKLPVGQLRFDYEKKNAEISISLLKEFRGKGIAKEALAQGVSLVRKEGVKNLLAEIHEKNTPSTILFEKLHFVYQKKRDNYLVYNLIL